MKKVLLLAAAAALLANSTWFLVSNRAVSGLEYDNLTKAFFAVEARQAKQLEVIWRPGQTVTTEYEL